MKAGKWLTAILCLMLSWGAQAQTEVRLAVHNAFSIPKELITQFERENNAKLVVVKVGSGNEMINKLILTRNNPIADVVYGVDNINVMKGKKFNLFAATQPASRAVNATLPETVAVNYGYITINYDKAWFQKHGKALPKSLAELASPAYRNLLVMPSPATSSVGLAFLLANIADMGEEATFQWWKKMRENGVKITKGWSEAYYTDFTLNGGSRPMVLSYSTSPAAEIYFSKGKYKTPPSGDLRFKGAVFRHVEGVAVLNKAKQPVLAAKLVQFLQSNRVQSAVQTSMWVYPAVKGVPLSKYFSHVNVPPIASQLNSANIAAKQQNWVSRWVRVVQR